MDAKPFSLGTERKETDNPVLIFWLKKINRHPRHSTQKDSVNKTDPDGFHSIPSFNLLLKFKDCSLNYNKKKRFKKKFSKEISSTNHAEL